MLSDVAMVSRLPSVTVLPSSSCASIGRVGGWDTPYPHAFEWEYFPGQARVGLALKAVMEPK